MVILSTESYVVNWSTELSGRADDIWTIRQYSKLTLLLLKHHWKLLHAYCYIYSILIHAYCYIYSIFIHTKHGRQSWCADAASDISCLNVNLKLSGFFCRCIRLSHLLRQSVHHLYHIYFELLQNRVNARWCRAFTSRYFLNGCFQINEAGDKLFDTSCTLVR